MSYEDFMRELEVLLAGIPAEEKEEALQYYADYFADAGKENEKEVLRELESPQKTAALIKAGLKGGMDSGEFTEYGYTDERFEKRDDLTRREPKKEKEFRNRYSYQGKENTSYTGNAFGNAGGSSYGNSSYGGSYSYGTGNQTYEDGNHAYNNENNGYGNVYGSNTQGHSSYQQKKAPWTNKWLKILLIALIVIFAFPVVVPLVIAAAAVVFGLAVAAVAVFFGLAVGAFGVVIAGVVIICAGISKLVAIPSVGLLTTGGGLLIFVIGLVASVAAVRLCMLVYPALFRFLVGLCRKPFHRKAGVSR